jgi:hypothetical protein
MIGKSIGKMTEGIQGEGRDLGKRIGRRKIGSMTGSID